MPTDKSGKFHMNPQRARAADANPKPPPAIPKGPAMPKGLSMPPVAGPAVPGAPPPMPDDEPHAKIFDHGDGTGHTETSDGGYHDHQNIETLKAALEQYFTEEEGEGGPEEAAEQGPPPMPNALHGM